MPAWIPVTLAAALFQTWRTALQQRLRGRLSVGAAGLVRYLYAVPVGVAFLLLYCTLFRTAPPVPQPAFWPAALGGGLAQIAGTSLLIMAFGHRSFAVGTAYSKTDAVQAAILAAVILHEELRPSAWIGIALGLAGVLTLSLAGRGLRPAELARAAVQPAALCGLGAGLGFAFSGVFIRMATEAVPTPDKPLAALATLVVINTMQTVLQGGWMAWRERDGLLSAFREWRSAAWVGALSAGGSACWFAGFALAPVALVRTVGQVEMVFTLLFSRFYLRETLRRSDVLGLLLIVSGVLAVLVLH